MRKKAEHQTTIAKMAKLSGLFSEHFQKDYCLAQTLTLKIELGTVHFASESDFKICSIFNVSVKEHIVVRSNMQQFS